VNKIIYFFRRNNFKFYLFGKIFTIDLSYVAFINLFLDSSGILSRKDVEICQRLFLYPLIWSCYFCPWFCLCAILNLLIYVCWTILHLCNETNLIIVYGILTIIEHSLQEFYWWFLHLYLSKKLGDKFLPLGFV
jgi:hypothetical protein